MKQIALNVVTHTTILALLTLVSGNALAEWVAIGLNDGGDIYADPSSMLKAGNQVKIWTLVDYKKPRVLGKLKPLLSMKVQTEFDCVEKQSRGLSFFAYAGSMGSGETENMSGAGISYIDTNPKKWTPIPPNGTGPALWKFACENR